MREYHSRLSDVEEQKNIKSAVIFGGATLLILILGIFFGIPLLSKVLNLFNKPAAITSDTKTTVLAPTLASLPVFTNKSSLIIKGTSSPNSKIKIFFGSSSDETISDDSGNFALNAGLSKGMNTIYAVTVDKNGNQSAKSNVSTVNYTDKEPSLTVSNPPNNQTFYGEGQKNISIEGQTDANNSVTVNDHIAIVESNGKFKFAYTLSNGDNQIKVVTIDPAGNKKEISLKITFNP